MSRCVTVLALFLAGCTHEVLATHTVRTASTVMDIQYQMVLDNVARFHCHPGMLPSHARLEEGTVQVSDEAGIDDLGIFWGSSPGFEGGPRAVRQLAEQWGTDAVTNPSDLKALQDVYRLLLGLPPEPDPEFLREAEEAESDDSDDDNGNDGPPSTIGAFGGFEEGRLLFVDESEKDESDQYDENGRERDSEERSNDRHGHSHAADRDRTREYPEVPQGWFHVGSKDDVPEHACYVGSYGDLYVWVPPEGMDDFSKFTLLVLSIMKSDLERTGGGGLMFTR